MIQEKLIIQSCSDIGILNEIQFPPKKAKCRLKHIAVCRHENSTDPYHIPIPVRLRRRKKNEHIIMSRGPRPTHACGYRTPNENPSGRSHPSTVEKTSVTHVNPEQLGNLDMEMPSKESYHPDARYYQPKLKAAEVYPQNNGTNIIHR